MRFASLASGSRGNALLVEHDATLVMIDCGLGIRALEQRMRAVGREPRDLSAVLITHEHSDHVRGLAAFSRRYDVPIWSTAGTAAAASMTSLARLNVFSGGRSLDLGALTIEDGFPLAADGTPVRLGIRPEALLFDDEGQNARVTVIEPVGHELIVMLDYFGVELTARVAPSCRWSVDDVVRMRPAIVQLHVFSQDDGRWLNARANN